MLGLAPGAPAPRPFREFGLLQRIARSQSSSELRASLKALKRFRPGARTWLLAKGMVIHRSTGWGPILKRVPKLRASKIATLANSVGRNLDGQDFRALLEGYVQWNKKEAEHAGDRNRRLWAVYESKASTLAMTMLRTATKRDLKLLRNSFQLISLTPSAQYFVLTLVRWGNAKDILKIIKRIERANQDIRYWFQIEMGHAVERRMTDLGGSLPIELLRISTRKGFREDSRNERSKLSRKDALPLKYSDNRALYLRIVAHAMIGAARQDNLDLLQRLAQHNYRMIARAAAIRLARLAGDAGIKMLQSTVAAAIERGNGEQFGLAVRDAEIQRLGLAELW